MMKPTMRTSLLAAGTIAGLAMSGGAFAAGPTCAEAQDESWMDPAAVQEMAEGMGYTIENMAVSDGNCYQLSALNTNGESVTTYLDPRTGAVVEEEIAQ